MGQELAFGRIGKAAAFQGLKCFLGALLSRPEILESPVFPRWPLVLAACRGRFFHSASLFEKRVVAGHELFGVVRDGEPS